MSSTFKFPNGYDVEVVRQSDIFEILKDKVTDIDVVIATVQQCEKDVEKFLREGRWTGIPYMGNIRTPKITQRNNTEERKAVIEEARRTMDVKAYNEFRRNLNISDNIEIKRNRLYLTKATISANKNLKRYNWLCKKFKNISFGRFKIYSECLAKVIENTEEYD